MSKVLITQKPPQPIHDPVQEEADRKTLKRLVARAVREAAEMGTQIVIDDEEVRSEVLSASPHADFNDEQLSLEKEAHAVSLVPDVDKPELSPVVLSVESDSPSLAAKPRQSMGKYSWRVPTKLKVNGLLQLRAAGNEFIVFFNNEEIGKWKQTRGFESDFESNLFSVCLWGATDVQSSVFSLTPDFYDSLTRTVFEMKVRKDKTVFEGVYEDFKRKYRDMGSEFNLVVVNSDYVKSTYDWADDHRSVQGGSVFAFAVCHRFEILKQANILMAGLFRDKQEILGKKSGSFDHSALDGNKHDHMTLEDFEQLKAMPEVPDLLDVESMLRCPDDDPGQYKLSKKIVDKMNKETCNNDSFLEPRPDGTLRYKRKFHFVPFFSIKDLTELHGVDADVDAPRIRHRNSGGWDEFASFVFKNVRKTKRTLTGRVRFESLNVEEVIRRAREMKKEVDEGKILEQISRIPTFDERRTMTRQDISSITSSVSNKIMELTNVEPGKRVTSDRRLLTDFSGMDHLFSMTKPWMRTGLIENSTFMRLRNKAKQSRQEANYIDSQKNVGVREDPEAEAFISNVKDEFPLPETAYQKIIDEFKVKKVGVDGNFCYLWVMDKVFQEMNRSMHKAQGPGLIVKCVPHTKAWLIMRCGKNEVKATLVIDRTKHDVLEEEWWHDTEDGLYSISSVFTVSKEKMQTFLNIEETYRLTRLRLLETTQFEPKQIADIINTQHSNLLFCILSSQVTSDQTTISLLRYLGMILSNGCPNRGPCSEVFKKIERCRSRLAAMVVNKMLKWVRAEEEERTEFQGVWRWKYRDWLTLEQVKANDIRVFTWYEGAYYVKTEGGKASSQRQIIDKMISLAFKAIDGKGKPPGDPERINTLLETLPSYDAYYQVDFKLLFQVMTKSFEDHKKTTESWKERFSSDLAKLIMKADINHFATGKSSFRHRTDKLSSGVVIKQKKMGAVTQVQYVSANSRTSMIRNVCKYPNTFSNYPLLDWSTKIHPVRVSLFKKLQLGGPREISILTPLARLSISTMEVIMRAFATQMDNETLTHPNKELKIVGYAAAMNALAKETEQWANRTGRRFLRMVYRTSADATKWCQLFRMICFMTMVMVVLAEFPELRDQCLEVLAQHALKKIEIPEEIVKQIMKGVKFNQESLRRLADEWNRDTPFRKQGECVFSLPDNMLQGILHYTSSVYHSLIQNYFTRRLSENISIVLNGAANKRFKIDVTRELDIMNNYKWAKDELSKALSNGVLRPLEYEKKMQDLKREKDEARRTLAANLRNQHTIPSWQVKWQNCASSDDTAIAVDVFIVGDETFLDEAKVLVRNLMNKSVVAKRNFYRRLGLEESLSKSSAGNPFDIMEYNSKFLFGAEIFDVVEKQIFAATQTPSYETLAGALTEWYNKKMSIISAGGSIKLCQQVTIAQMTSHYKILGGDMSRVFPAYVDEHLLVHQHVSLGAYEYELNTAIVGLFPFGLTHQTWLMNKNTMETERRLIMNANHELDSKGILRLGVKIEVGNNMRALKLRRDMLQELEDYARRMGVDNIHDALEAAAPMFLAGAVQPSLKLLADFSTLVTKPKVREQTTSGTYKLSTLLLHAPSISILVKGEHSLKVRCNLFVLGDIVRDELHPKPSPSEAMLGQQKKIIDDLEGLIPTETQRIMVSLATRVQSSVRTSVDPRHIVGGVNKTIYQVWSSDWSGLTPVVKADFDHLRKKFPWLRESVESTLAETIGFFDSALEVVRFFMQNTDMSVTVRSRSGIEGLDGVKSAVIRTIESQYSKGRMTEVTEIFADDQTDDYNKELSEIILEAQIAAFFPVRRENLGNLIKDFHEKRQGKVVDKSLNALMWAGSVLSGSPNTQYLVDWSRESPIIMTGDRRSSILVVWGNVRMRADMQKDMVKRLVCTSPDLSVQVKMARALKVRPWVRWAPADEDTTSYYVFDEDVIVSEKRPRGVPIRVSSHLLVPDYSSATGAYRTSASGTSKVMRLYLIEDSDSCAIPFPIPAIRRKPSKEQRTFLSDICFENNLCYSVFKDFVLGRALSLNKLVESLESKSSDAERLSMKLKMDRTKSAMVSKKIPSCNFSKMFRRIKTEFGMGGLGALDYFTYFTKVGDKVDYYKSWAKDSLRMFYDHEKEDAVKKRMSLLKGGFRSEDIMQTLRLLDSDHQFTPEEVLSYGALNFQMTSDVQYDATFDIAEFTSIFDTDVVLVEEIMIPHDKFMEMLDSPVAGAPTNKRDEKALYVLKFGRYPPEPQKKRRD